MSVMFWMTLHTTWDQPDDDDSNNTAAYRNGQLVLDLRPDNKQFNGDLFCVTNMSLSLDDTWVLGGVQCQEKL